MFWIKISSSSSKSSKKEIFKKLHNQTYLKVGKNYIVTKIHQKVALALLSIFWHFLQVSSQDEQSQLRGSGSGSFSQGSHLQENFDHFRCEGSPQNHPVRHVETRTQQGKKTRTGCVKNLKLQREMLIFGSLLTTLLKLASFFETEEIAVKIGWSL